MGQPRDNNPKAAYVVYDMDEGTIELRRVDYDMGAAQKREILTLAWFDRSGQSKAKKGKDSNFFQSPSIPFSRIRDGNYYCRIKRGNSRHWPSHFLMLAHSGAA